MTRMYGGLSLDEIEALDRKGFWRDHDDRDKLLRLALPALIARAREADGKEEGWRDIESVPKDGTTIEVRGVMQVHHMQGAKFSMMPADWRPDTPQTVWRTTDWRPAPPAKAHEAADDGEDRG